MKKLNQYLLQRRAVMILIPQVFIIYQIIIMFGKTSTTDFYSFFVLFVYIALMIVGFLFIFIFSLTPYIEKIATDINVKESVINLPKLYSFSDSLEFTINIPKSKNTSYLLEEKSSFLNLNKFDIKLLDKDKNEISIDIYPSISKHQQINIRLKNNKDIIKSKMLFIKVEKEINLSIDYMSFNRK